MAYYDDLDFTYQRFWQDRDYENRSEILALERLIGRIKGGVVVDIGGGFGRLSTWLADKFDEVYPVEPSVKMRQAAKTFLAARNNVYLKTGSAAATGLPGQKADVVVMVRLMHHLPDPTPALSEISRILKPGGILVLEFANSIHFLSRLKSWLTGRGVPLQPVERRSPKRIAQGSIPFVNHHPLTVLKQLKLYGFKPVKILSVSNLRHKLIKSLLPLSALLILESVLQPLLSGLYFGPSIWILAQKRQLIHPGRKTKRISQIPGLLQFDLT